MNPNVQCARCGHSAGLHLEMFGSKENRGPCWGFSDDDTGQGHIILFCSCPAFVADPLAKELEEQFG